jgi:Tfp pilus assembly protein PilO
MLSLQEKVSWFVRVQRAMVIAMIALAGGFYAFAYRPQVARLTSLKNQIDQTRQELRSAQSQTTMLPSVEADVERLQVRMQKFKAMPKRDEQDQFVKDISQLAQLAGLKKEPTMIGNAVIRGEKVCEIPYSLTMDGDFNSIFAFLRHTENLQRLTRASKLNIKGTDKAGQVKTQLTMSIYYLAE